MNPHLTKLINELSTSVNEFEKLSSEELPKDTTFYKYRSLNSDCEICRFKDIVLRNQLYASDFSRMNDPMEGVFKSLHLDYAQKLMDEKQKTFVCSMTTKSNNFLMWSYYAGGGTGCCIKFTLKDTIDNNIHVKKMNYVDKILDADFQTGSLEERVINILTRKTIAWEPECEVRVLTKTHSVPIEIKSIIFGCYIDNKLLKELSQFIRDNSKSIEICKYSEQGDIVYVDQI